MGGNLPDDVTPSDIDDHFGEPDTKQVHGDVVVGVSVEVHEHSEEKEMKGALREAVKNGNWDEVVHVEVVEEV